MLPIFLIFAVSAIALSPCAIMLVRRAKALNKIKALASRCGFKIKNAHRFVFLARNRGATYDVVLANKQRVYAVKLWSALHNDSTLVLCPDNTYYVARGVSEPFEQKDRGEYNLRNRRRKVPDTKLTVKVGAGREMVNVLLICPPYKKIMQRRGKDILIYEQGDRIFGKTVYFPDGFEKLILESSDPRRAEMIKLGVCESPKSKR